MQLKTNIIAAVILMTGMVACTKMNRELAAADKESSISKTKVLSTGAGVSALNGSTARIGDTVDVIIKLGQTDRPVKLMLGGTELNIINRYSAIDSILDGYKGNKVIAYVPVEHLIVRIPPDFAIGATNLSLYVDGIRKPAYSFNVVKPMLLFPGKVSVESLYRSTEDTTDLGWTIRYDIPSVRKDGAEGTASSNAVTDLAIDKQTGVIYFLDQWPDGTFLRKKEAGIVTTLGGNGTDPEATHIRDKKFHMVNAMKVGPDGMLYLALIDQTPPSEEGAAIGFPFVTHSQIVRLDLRTGELTSMIGKSRSANVFGERYGLEDGRADTALVGAPYAMEFDKEGNLYFVDGLSTYGGPGQLLRVLRKNGMVETLLGNWEKYSYDYTTTTGANAVVEQYYAPDGGHVDGFAPEAMVAPMTRIAIAGNGKIYVVETPSGSFGTNIREINPDTREVSTVIGLPIGVTTSIRTGDFKEIDFYTYTVTSLDVDYDGDILYSAVSSSSSGGLLYKMDLKAETVSLIAGGNQASNRNIYNPPVDGLSAFFYSPQRIVFDQTGKLYLADQYGTAGVVIKGVTIQR